MKNTKESVKKRRDNIFRMIQENGDIKVEELMELVEASPLTIRRDLQYLESKNLIERYYGGVKLNGMSLVQEVTDEDAIYKQLIGQRAAEYVEDGDTIFINTSSTALAILPYITAKRVTVVTNNGNAINTPYRSDVTVILVGGELRHVKGTMVGDFALDNIKKVAANKCFLGCSGFSSDYGMTTAILSEVVLNQAFAAQTEGAVILMGTSEKIGKKSSFLSEKIERFDVVITDEYADKNEIAKLQDQNLIVDLVSRKDRK